MWCTLIIHVEILNLFRFARCVCKLSEEHKLFQRISLWVEFSKGKCLGRTLRLSKRLKTKRGIPMNYLAFKVVFSQEKCFLNFVFARHKYHSCYGVDCWICYSVKVVKTLLCFQTRKLKINDDDIIFECIGFDLLTARKGDFIETLPKAQRTRGLSSYYKLLHKSWSNNFRILTKHWLPNLASEFWPRFNFVTSTKHQQPS